MSQRPHRILLIAQYFPPESNAASIRVGSFMNNWKKMENTKVTVLTSHPNFPEGKLHEGYKMTWTSVDPRLSDENATVRRSWVFLAENKGIVKRSISFLSTFVSFLINGLFTKTDVIVASSPPLTIAFCGYILSKMKRVPLIFDVRDLWPEAISYTKMNFPRPLLNILQRITIRIYKDAMAITVTSDHQKKSVESYGIDPAKVYLFSNGFDMSKMRKLPDTDQNVQQIKKTINPDGKFTIGYIGNFGRLYDFDFLLNLIKKTQDLNVHYIIGGAGVMRDHIIHRIQTEKIKNVSYIGKTAHADMCFYINAIDLSIIPMKTIPINAEIRTAKLFEILACEKPVLFIGPPNSESGEIAVRSNLGFLCSDDFNQCIEVIKTVMSNPAGKKLNAEYLNQFDQVTTANNFYKMIKSRMNFV